MAEITCIEGKVYRLHFEDSEEGKAEAAAVEGGWPSSVVAVCTDSRPDYLTFEEFQPETGAECYEFFLSLPSGEWWDENRWSRLTAVELIEADGDGGSSNG